MFQKLAPAVVFGASLILVVSRMAFSVHPPPKLVDAFSHAHGSENTCIVSQLPRKS